MLRVLDAGESHGCALVGIIEGLPAGLLLSEEQINAELSRRQAGYGRGERMRIESDRVKILSGLSGEETTGAPLSLLIENVDVHDESAKPPERVPRPGHADLAGALKYGLEDLRDVRERASARQTAMRVAVGSVARQLLGVFDIRLTSLVTQVGSILTNGPDSLSEELLQRIEASTLRCPDILAEEEMKRLIDQARADGDTLGGAFLLFAENVPPGLGSYVSWDRRLDGKIASAVMSIPGVKAVEIGDAVLAAGRMGSQAHDEIIWENGFQRSSNRAGGLEGGVTNGDRIVVKAYMKPIPTLERSADSVDMATKEKKRPPLLRADTCAVSSAGIIGEAALAWTLAEAFLEKFGGDSMAEVKCAHGNYLSRIHS
ncbi:MAG: chorismate synthase [bacterium]